MHYGVTMTLDRNDAHTPIKGLYEILLRDVPRDEWVPLSRMYQIVEAGTILNEDDRRPSYHGSSVPRWKRNVRHAFQIGKKKGEVLWSRGGFYLIPSGAQSHTSGRSGGMPVSLEEFRKTLANRSDTGDKGEDYVVALEKDRLAHLGRIELAERVERTSLLDVGAGFDILSFNDDGSRRFIEVKTTNTRGATFVITANELTTAEKLGSAYWIYLVSGFGSHPKLRMFNNPVSMIPDLLSLTPSSYEVRLRRLE